MARVGVLLSGCGVQDGSEIHEAVLTLLALDEAGAEIVCLAPNKNQTRVVNHLTGETTTETRNVLVESARIARGNIRDLAEVNADDLDAIVLPGGYGAALNLCDFAMKGEACTVDPHVARLLTEMNRQGKPIGSICISPVILACLFGKDGARVTIGTDAGTAAKIRKMGAVHMECAVHEHIVDEKNRLVTSPAYMLASSIKELRAGIERMVFDVLRLIDAPAIV